VYYCRQGDYAPKPADIRNVTLTRANLEMAERMAENAHDSWAQKKKLELESLGTLPVDFIAVPKATVMGFRPPSLPQ